MFCVYVHWRAICGGQEEAVILSEYGATTVLTISLATQKVPKVCLMLAAGALVACMCAVNPFANGTCPAKLQYLEAADAGDPNFLPDFLKMSGLPGRVKDTKGPTKPEKCQIHISHSPALNEPDERRVCMQPVVTAALVGACPAHPQQDLGMNISAQGIPGAHTAWPVKYSPPVKRHNAIEKYFDVKK